MKIKHNFRETGVCTFRTKSPEGPMHSERSRRQKRQNSICHTELFNPVPRSDHPSDHKQILRNLLLFSLLKLPTFGNTTQMSAPFPVLRPASCVRLSDVLSSLSVKQQALMRWSAADLQGDDSVQFSEILAADHILGAGVARATWSSARSALGFFSRWTHGGTLAAGFYSAGDLVHHLGERPRPQPRPRMHASGAHDAVCVCKRCPCEPLSFRCVASSPPAVERSRL